MDAKRGLKRYCKSLQGIKYIKANYKKKELTLEYDLMEIKLKDIEQKVVDLDYYLPLGFFNKLKRWTIHLWKKTKGIIIGQKVLISVQGAQILLVGI